MRAESILSAQFLNGARRTVLRENAVYYLRRHVVANDIYFFRDGVRDGRPVPHSSTSSARKDTSESSGARTEGVDASAKSPNVSELSWNPTGGRTTCIREDQKYNTSPDRFSIGSAFV